MTLIILKIDSISFTVFKQNLLIRHILDLPVLVKIGDVALELPIILLPGL